MTSPSPQQPEKPCPCEGAKADPGDKRRDALFKIGIGLNVVAGAMISLPIIGYVMSSFFKVGASDWVSLGPVDNFPDGATTFASYVNPIKKPWDGETATIPCWVRRFDAGKQFQVFAINCTHLGCPVRWFQESKLFMCPCHGGAFYENGDHASGPPPRGLYTYQTRITAGNLEILAGHLPNLSDPNP